MPRRVAKSPKILPSGRPARGGASLSEALALQMTAAIAEGAVGIGELIPPERELARRHKVGRVTVRGALGKLIAAGLIESRPGVGHVVVRSEARALEARPVGLIYRNLHAFGSGTSKSVPAIESELAARGRALLIGSSGLTAEGEDECIARFRNAGAGALVIAPATSGTRSRELEAWIRRGQPVVLEGHSGKWLLPDEVATCCDRIDVDNRGGVSLALEHLVGLGHHRVAYLTFGSGEGSERLAGFLDAVRELGLEHREEWNMIATGNAERAVQLWRDAGMPGAVVCSDDDTALEFIAAARRAGFDCPGDLSVVGFGNESSRGPGVLSQLTTVDHSREELASEIVRLLECQLSGEKREAEDVRIRPRLLARASCAARVFLKERL